MIKERINTWTVEQRREAYDILSKDLSLLGFINNISLNDIINSVLQVKQVSIEAFNSKCRKRPLAESRQMVYFFCNRERLPMTLTDIGKFTNRDHATVLYGIRNAKRLIETDKTFASEIFEIGLLIDKLKRDV